LKIHGLVIGLPYSDKKIIPQDTEQDGTDGSSVGIPPVSQKKKTSEFRSEPFLEREKPSECRAEPFLRREIRLEFHSEPFLGREKPLEFCSEPFLDEKNPRNSVPNYFRKRKTSEIRSESFSEEKEPWNSVPNHFQKRKNFRKGSFCELLRKTSLFRGIPFCSISFRVTEWTLPKYSESHGISTLFCGIMETVLCLFCGIFS
jgi:hypothetical protein